VGLRSGPTTIDVVSPWSKPPTGSPRSARCRRARPNCHRVVATVVEAAHHQSDLRGHPLQPHATRDPTAAAPWPPWSKPPATSRISEAARCRRVRPDCRCAVVTVVEAAHCAMVAGAWLGGGVNAGPRPPSYSSSSLYRPPWLTTTSSFSSTTPVGQRRRPRRDDRNSIVLCAAPSRCPTP
jgi:hypothetical protein